MLGKEVREVGIFCEDGRACLASGLKDGEVLGFPQAQVADRPCGNVKSVRNPFRQGWRKVCVNPDPRAALCCCCGRRGETDRDP